MIFLTVGHQMPFDRLVQIIDRWAAMNPSIEVFAQVGRSSLRPSAMKCQERVDPDHFVRLIKASEAVVAHAGMGTILTCLEHGKPVVVMPRRAELRETRNDHQLATARHLQGRSGIYVAMEESSILEAMNQVAQLRGSEPKRPVADASLLATVRDFIFGASGFRVG